MDAKKGAGNTAISVRVDRELRGIEEVETQNKGSLRVRDLVSPVPRPTILSVSDGSGWVQWSSAEIERFEIMSGVVQDTSVWERQMCSPKTSFFIRTATQDIFLHPKLKEIT